MMQHWTFLLIYLDDLYGSTVRVRGIGNAVVSAQFTASPHAHKHKEKEEEEEEEEEEEIA